jgi:hypothetical protein
VGTVSILPYWVLGDFRSPRVFIRQTNRELFPPFPKIGPLAIISLISNLVDCYVVFLASLLFVGLSTCKYLDLSRAESNTIPSDILHLVHRRFHNSSSIK